MTQWVQCERGNCKKWRKLPAHVDMASLPEKWYCEMNKWDPDRAYCGGPGTMMRYTPRALLYYFNA